MKKVLITGSEGFVGQHLWEELQSNGYEVYGTALHQLEKGLPENVFVCDIESQDQLHTLITKIMPDAIVHLAGQPKPGLSFDIPQKTVMVNTIGTVNLLEAVRAIPNYRPRLILVGTSEEHGIVPQEDLPITENTSLNPINPYAISKVANWFFAKEYVRSFNFDIIYVTPFTHTGPGQMPGFLSPDIASQIVDIEKGRKKPVIYTGNLTVKRDIGDVRDFVRAYRLFLEKGISGERYLISTGKSVPVKEVADKIVALSKIEIKLEIDPARVRPNEVPELFGDHSKLSSATGWQPEILLEKTLQDILDWYREKG